MVALVVTTLLVFLFVGALWFGLLEALCLLVGFGLFRMACHAGIPWPWLAFLPLGNLKICLYNT